MDLVTLFLIFTVIALLGLVFIAAIFSNFLKPPPKIPKDDDKDPYEIVKKLVRNSFKIETETELKAWEKAFKDGDLNLMRFLIEQHQKRNGQPYKYDTKKSKIRLKRR